MYRLLLQRTALASFLLVSLAKGGVARAQRHSLGSAPPTAPAVPPATPPHPATPIVPVSSGLGVIQFVAGNAIVPAPQSLTRQLLSDDERVRLSALASLGAPAQYLVHGHVPSPHAIELELAQLGDDDDLDALLTVDLGAHIVTAILIPSGELWRRAATMTFASGFGDASATPSTFVRAMRSWTRPDRYRAVFHASNNTASGDFMENEADLRIFDGRAVVVMSFVSGSRLCDAGELRPPHQSCEVVQRWLEPDPDDPTNHFTLITGVGHMSAHEAEDPLTRSRNYRLTRLRYFTCQPFVYSDEAMHFEPTATASPCVVHEPLPGSVPKPEPSAPGTTAKPEHEPQASPSLR